MVFKGKKVKKNKKKDKVEKSITVVHAYEDRPVHLHDPLKHPDPNEQVPVSKAPKSDLRKKLFLCGNPKCKHDVRDHRALPNPSIGNTAGTCKVCKCSKYRFTGKVDFGAVPKGKKKK